MHTSDSITHRYWERRTTSWRRRLVAVTGIWSRVFLINKAGSAYPVFYNFIPAARAFEQVLPSSPL